MNPFGVNRRTVLAGLAAHGLSGLLTSQKTMASRTADDFMTSSFFIPEETTPHLRTFMQWPVNREVHPDGLFLDDLQSSIADIANTIAEFEPVVMLMAREHASNARRLLSAAVDIWPAPTDDLWCRDSGPLFALHDGRDPVVLSMNFNGWGNKQVHGNDGKVAERVAAELGLPFIDTGLTGEPGGIETDGAGTLIAHESCWVNPNRNRLSRDEIERRLLTAYGADKMIWAPGVAGLDITDDHIDALARFTRPGEILMQIPFDDGSSDPFIEGALTTEEILRTAKDARGSPFAIIPIPEPNRTRSLEPDFLASYVNYYVCEGAVIMAEFGDTGTDREAQQILAEIYPDREIVALNVDPLGETGGGIHCATQQQPAFAGE